MAQFESLLWDRHPRTPRVRIVDPRRPAIDARTEFIRRPLGRLGRPLLEEVETYLAFYALAHEHAGQGV
jgi:hypothetical protein